ncbi:hypothetical protein EDB85DRAFT_1888573 [Lactarius pseudohatsudake]|nr:hypothetical protein EDB85DRAFT_1888573 [Lactarius pseudohatsudake]
MALRARQKESQKHPGKPDLPRQKRSSSVVQAEKAEKARVQTEREETRGQSIQEAADIEVHMEEQRKEKLANAHHPLPSTQKKIPRPSSKVPQASKGAISSDNVAQGEVLGDGGKEDVSDGKNTVESEDEESGDILDESESDLGKESAKERAKKKKKKKKPERGDLRAAVQAAQGKDVRDGDLKRKAGSSVDAEVFHTQKKYKKANTGLYDDWSKRAQPKSPGEDDVKGDVDIPILDTTDQSRSHSVVLFSSSSRPTTSMFNSDDDDEGGISDNAGEVSERRDLVGKPMRPSTPKTSHYGGSRGLKLGEGTLTRVISTTSVPTFIKPVTSSLVALTRRKKGDIRLGHLSTHLQTTFIEDFTPRLYDLFGTLKAWEQPTGADLQRLWKRVFPHEKGLDFQTGDGVIVLKLIEDRLSHWRKKFGERGLEALEEITFNDLPENDTTHRQWWCQWALSGDDNSCRPFYYSTYEEPDLEVEGSKLTVKGIFQSPLIAAILGTHMACVYPIRDEDRLDRKPVGALVHSIQAAKRAISWWETGELVKPKRPLNEYSKANWGDHVEIREGHTVHISSTSDLVAIVSKLKDKQWDKILKAALLSAKHKKKSAVVASEPQQPQPFTAQVEPRDNDSDLAEEDGPGSPGSI